MFCERNTLKNVDNTVMWTKYILKEKCVKIKFFRWFHCPILTAYCKMYQNGQTHFKNIGENAARFLKNVWPFWDQILNTRLHFCTVFSRRIFLKVCFSICFIGSYCVGLNHMEETTKYELQVSANHANVFERLWSF